jgi:precorrin-3B synthase
VTRSDDPIAAIDACPGYPACASACVETRKAARRLAAMLPSLGIKSAHISGCAKGCARSAKAELVLVGGESDFGIVRNGHADDPPEARVSSNLDDLPTRLRNLTHG